jgi:hypothetical protein
MWRHNSAFSFYGRTGLCIFYGRTGLRVVVTSVCDGVRVRHKRPTGPGPALPDSRVFTDWARHGGCRARSITEGRPGLEWYLFTSTIQIRRLWRSSGLSQKADRARPGTPRLPDFHRSGPPWGVPGRVRHRKPIGSKMISFHFNYPDSPKFQSNG